MRIGIANSWAKCAYGCGRTAVIQFYVFKTEVILCRLCLWQEYRRVRSAVNKVEHEGLDLKRPVLKGGALCRRETGK